MICKKDTVIDYEYYSGNRISMMGCACNRAKNYRQLATNLNSYHKTQEMNRKVEVEPTSPTKKGFSVRRQKRTSSLMKSTQESPVKNVALDMPKIPGRTFTKKIYNSNA